MILELNNLHITQKKIHEHLNIRTLFAISLRSKYTT